MALVEGCKHEVEITIPVAEVEAETARAVADIQKKVRLPGFRPGKAPTSIVRTKFAQEIRTDVLDSLLSKHFRKKMDEENLIPVGQPSVTDLHFHSGEPIRFKAQFEVSPNIDLGEYRGITVEYREPEVTDADVQERLDSIREKKADYANIDPRPIEDGDYAVISLKTIAGVDPSIEQDERMFQVGGQDTLPEFNDNLRGAMPGDEREFAVTYPEDYPEQRFAGKSVTFHIEIKAIRRKELPEANDEFARDLGDYQNLEELLETIRKAIFREREVEAQREAKNKIIDKLIEAHQFPIPEAFVERQSDLQIETQVRALAAQGIDPRKLNIDWQKFRESHRDRAVHDVKASLIIDKIGDRESIDVLQEEVDREVQRIARHQREPIPAVRQALEKDGSIRRIANQIRTEKILNFLFENARKEAPAEVSE